MTSLTVEIARMTEVDLDEVAAIERTVFSDPWTKRAFAYDLHSVWAIPLVARVGGKVVGYASLYHVADELQIGNLAVAPAWQRQGIGSQLMSKVLALAGELQVKTIVLEVRESNVAARTLYGKFGFGVVGRRRLYYFNPIEDALVMARRL